MSTVDLNKLGVILQLGFNLTELKLAGFTAKNLIQAGYGISDLSNTLLKMVQVGYTVSNLHDASFSVFQLYNIGFSLRDLSNGGFIS